MSTTRDIILERKNRCGLVTLNRPKALNAINFDMIGQLEEHYIEWAGDADIYGVVMRSAGGRAFCSGGDLKAFYALRQAGKVATLLDKFTCEYQFNWTLDRFIKPHVALMDGYVFGGGAGISLYGTHKVAGENYSFAMPETAIGFFPDIGATHFLPRLPGQIGLYLALTGNQINRADAYALGLVTHCIDAPQFDAIIAAMCEAEPIDPVLDDRHADPGASELLRLQGSIDEHFSHDSVEEIVSSLKGASGADADWANETLGIIGRNSPLSLKVAFRQMRNSGRLTLDQALELEARIAHNFLTGEELYEGVRALLVDKDGKPDWSPASLEDVSAGMVEAYFRAPESDGFKLVNPFL